MYNSYAGPYGPMINPYLPQQAGLSQARQEVTKVSGEPGARAYQLAPNSSALLLDETGELVWLITTDGAGYKTVTPFDIHPHQAAAAPDFTDLEARIQKLEEAIARGATSNPADVRAEYVAFTGDSSAAPAGPAPADDRRAEKRR